MHVYVISLFLVLLIPVWVGSILSRFLLKLLLLLFYLIASFIQPCHNLCLDGFISLDFGPSIVLELKHCLFTDVIYLMYVGGNLLVGVVVALLERITVGMVSKLGSEIRFVRVGYKI